MTMLADTGAIAFEARSVELPGLAEELYSFRRPRCISISAPVGESVEWIRPIVERFQAIASLADDWDGYGSPAPAVDTLIDALDVLQRFMLAAAPVPAVAPTPTGGVQFEWHQGGWDIEVDVDPSGPAIAWGENLATGESFHGTVDEAREDLVLNLKRITVDDASRLA